MSTVTATTTNTDKSNNNNNNNHIIIMILIKHNDKGTRSGLNSQGLVRLTYQAR